MIAKWSVAILFATATATAGWALDPNSEEALLGAIHSEVQPPTPEVVGEILESVCPDHISLRPRIGCNNWDESSPQAELRPHQVNGVLFGHFLSASSDDAVLSANRGENHPERFGGTLFLTRDTRGWKALWYRSGLITRNCIKVKTSSGLFLLVCESSYIEGGHWTHDLYSVQFLSSEPKVQLLLSTDTFAWPDVLQKETLDRVRLTSVRGHTVLRVYLHYARIPNTEHLDFTALDNMPTRAYQVDFLLEDARFLISPSSAAAFAKLFRRTQ